jgi:hypothetical protein
MVAELAPETVNLPLPADTVPPSVEIRRRLWNFMELIVPFIMRILLFKVLKDLFHEAM